MSVIKLAEMTTATRVLRLLSLLQARREWSGAELSERLEVDVRTIRRDANRLRELGYVIESAAGPGGGYRLAAGTTTPPLLLDDNEAITVALALGAAASTLGNLSDSALSVLAKLDQLLPARLRRKWSAVTNVTMSLAGSTVPVDVKQLASLATACRDERRVKFKYGDARQRVTVRDVEPARLAHTGRVWYLIAWDVQREAWRTFRLDRIDTSTPIVFGPKFTPRAPQESFDILLARAIHAAPHRYVAKLRLAMAVNEAKRHVPAAYGLLEAESDATSILTIGGHTYEGIAISLLHFGLDFELMEPPGLAETLRILGQRLLCSTAAV